MSIAENIRLAFASLTANKMRAALTMLGIIIGIGAVIGIMTLGDSLSGYMTSTMQDMGTNNVTLSLKQRQEDDKRTGSGGDMAQMRQQMMAQMMGAGEESPYTEKDLISAAMLSDIREKYADDVDYISVSDSVGSGSATDGKKYANLSLLGVSADYSGANGIDMKDGRFIGERDVDGSRKVAVVSEKLAAKMFGAASPLGKQVFLSTDTHSGTYTVIGVYWYKRDMMDASAMSGGSDNNLSTNVYIPLSTAGRITGNDGSQSVTIVTKAGSDSAAFAKEVESYTNDVFYARNKDYQVSAFSMDSMLDTMTQMMDTLQIAISAIAAISLLVGGIGVMNIMLVSITERTREIGTRKALGATNGEIRTQFITEAVIICLVGGIIGIIFGTVLGAFGASLLGFPASASLFAILLASGFSTAIGLFFGYYPANKAAKMDPIDALRYE
ncbi:MAG: ABC transporter permease [Clostridiales Family XIII bacterium]|jgi:putative ABC transport system permease protein|nr:ABC transporter permease [Clostridiales Family XIII bacterium]